MRDIKEFYNDIMTGVLNIRRIYVCSPLSSKSAAGIKANMLIARDKCNQLNGVFREYGIKAWAPHAYLPVMLDDSIPEERELAINFGLNLLEMSDVVYVFGPKLSEGMKNEIKFAIEHEMDIIVDGDVKDEFCIFIKKYANR